MTLSYITTPGALQHFHPEELPSNLDGSSKSNQAFVVLIHGMKQDLQQFGIDYDEKFSSVAKQDTLRMILSFVAVYDLEMHQLNIKTIVLGLHFRPQLASAAYEI